MDDTTFDYRLSDVAAGSARFPGRPSRQGSEPAALVDAVVAVRDRGDEFARHAWDESGHL